MPNQPALGLFFTDYLLEVSKVSSDGTKLIQFGQLPIPPNLILNSQIQDTPAFTKLLQQLLIQAQPHPVKPGEEVVIGVSDNRIFLREFTLPKNVGKEIEDAINWQIRSLLPTLPSEVETDWQIIGSDSNGQIEVLLAAIPKTIIESHLKIAQAAGLQVVAIEPAVFANIRIIRPELLKGKNQLLVHLGHNYCEFTYLTSGNPRFSDLLPNTEVQKKGNILNAIRDYYGFANSKHPTRLIQEIVVSGSQDQVSAVVAHLKAQNLPGIPATSRLTTSSLKDHHLFHTVHGLSLKPTDQLPAFNLLPLEFRLSLIRRKLTSVWKLILSLLIFFTILGNLGIFYLYQSSRARQFQLDLLKQRYTQELAEPQSQAIIEQTKQLNSTANQLTVLRQAIGGEEVILKQLSGTVPAGITLTSLLVTRGTSTPKLIDPNSAWIVAGTANSRQLVLDFYDLLTAQPEFANGRLHFGSLEKETAITFRIASQPIQSTTKAKP